MATSPEYLRLASSANRALADTALDALRDAVLVIDSRRKQHPVVLANAAARQSFVAERDSNSLIERALSRLLNVRSIMDVEDSITSLRDGGAPLSRVVTWRFLSGDRPVLTEFKALSSAVGQRLIMVTFAPASLPLNLNAAVDELTLGLLILDLDLKVRYANASAVKAGRSIPGGVLGCAVSAFDLLSLVPPEVYTRALGGVRFQSTALAFPAPDQSTRLFELDIQPLQTETSVTGLLVLFGEVNERRMGARTPGGGDRRLLALTEHARDIITVADAGGTLLYVSGGVKNALGYASEERESSNVFDLIHPDDGMRVKKQFEDLAAGRIEGFSSEYRVRHKDGSHRSLEAVFVSELHNPLIGGIVINSRDITERKLAESRLAQREEVFRLAADAVDGVIFEWDIPRGIVRRSRGVQEVLGIAPEDVESSNDAWWERIHPRDAAAAKRVLNLALIEGRGWTITYRVRDARGRYKSMLERGLIQRNPAGDPVRAIGCCMDVSEIRRLTDLLADTQRLAKIGGWEYSYVDRELTWTDEMFRIYDTGPGEFDVSSTSMLARCVPQSADVFRKAYRKAEACGGVFDLELEVITLKEKRIWVRIIGRLEMLDGQPSRAFGSLQNIQAQKSAQLALEMSTGWLKLSMDMAQMHAWRWDKVNDSFEFATLEGSEVHLPKAQPTMASMIARVHPNNQASVKRAFESAFSSRSEVRGEFRALGDDGLYRSYDTTARPVFDAADNPRGLVGVMQDVTARRDSEQRLRQSEELLHATTANTADILFLVDATLHIRFINKGVASLSIEKIIGSHVAVLLPDAAQASVLDKLRHILATGETSTYEFVASEAGEKRYFENRAVLVQDDGVGAGISVSMRDITERKRLEQEILEVSGRERASIGRDLHDGLGQELTGIALMLRALAKRIETRCPEVKDNVDEVVTLVNQSIDAARSLARGLLPVRSETGDLTSALRALASRGRDLYGLDVTFRVAMSRELSFEETDASHLYRIAQEALTNAARHGRARHVDIELSASATSFALRIADDGEGFTQTSPSSAGMGLKIMKYRAGMIAAKFNIESNLPQGTVVMVTGDRTALGEVDGCQ